MDRRGLNPAVEGDRRDRQQPLARGGYPIHGLAHSRVAIGLTADVPDCIHPIFLIVFVIVSCMTFDRFAIICVICCCF